jgi:hypothetical protein
MASAPRACGVAQEKELDEWHVIVHLISEYLVASLRAAPSSHRQVTAAFAIQEMLKLLRARLDPGNTDDVVAVCGPGDSAASVTLRDAFQPSASIGGFLCRLAHCACPMCVA